MTQTMKRITRWTILLLCLSSAVAAMAGETGSAAPRHAAATTATSQVSREILQASSPFFAGFPFVQAESLYKKAFQGNDTSHFLVSVQTPEEFARGHVPGAINIPLKELTGGSARETLPRNKKIVLTCDNGHRSMAAALFLAQLGYDTGVLSFGLSRWNGSVPGLPHPYPGSAGYPVSTAPVTEAGVHELPPLGTAGNELPVRRAEAVFSGRDLFIDNREVHEKAVLGKDSSYFLVSLQRPEDYARGHVPGAINIPAAEFAREENLRRLPRDRKIVLICYIGHWGAAGAFLLNQLGYEAYDMRFGTLGWNDTTAGLGELRELLVGMGHSLGYPVTGEAPGKGPAPGK